MMTLAQIEELVLSLTGGDRYADLSVDVLPEKIADFALLHQCVELAQNEIRILTKIPALMKWANQAVVASTGTYTLPDDWDLPIKLFYFDTATLIGHDLIQLYSENIVQKLGRPLNLLAEGTPNYYVIGEATAVGLTEVYLAPTPNRAGTLTYTYLPIIPSQTAAGDLTVLFRKYPMTVIKFATAFAFQIMKKDQTNFDKWYLLGKADLPIIQERELSANSQFQELPDTLTRTRRRSRYSR